MFSEQRVEIAGEPLGVAVLKARLNLVERDYFCSRVQKQSLTATYSPASSTAARCLTVARVSSRAPVLHPSSFRRRPRVLLHGKRRDVALSVRRLNLKVQIARGGIGWYLEVDLVESNQARR